MGGFTASIVEEATFAWLEPFSYSIAYGPNIALGELTAERRDYGQIIIEDRLRQALARILKARAYLVE